MACAEDGSTDGIQTGGGDAKAYVGGYKAVGRHVLFAFSPDCDIQGGEEGGDVFATAPVQAASRQFT